MINLILWIGFLCLLPLNKSWANVIEGVGTPDHPYFSCNEDRDAGAPARVMYMKGHNDKNKKGSQIKICLSGNGTYKKKLLSIVKEKDWFPDLIKITIPYTNLSLGIAKLKEAKPLARISEVRFVCDYNLKNVPKKARLIFPTEAESAKNGARLEIPCTFKSYQVSMALIDAQALIDKSSIADLEKSTYKIMNLAKNCDKHPEKTECEEWRVKMAEVVSGSSLAPLKEPAQFRCLAINAGLNYSQSKRSKESKQSEFGDLDIEISMTEDDFTESDYLTWFQNRTPTCSADNQQNIKERTRACVSELERVTGILKTHHLTIDGKQITLNGELCNFDDDEAPVLCHIGSQVKKTENDIFDRLQSNDRYEFETKLEATETYDDYDKLYTEHINNQKQYSGEIQKLAESYIVRGFPFVKKTYYDKEYFFPSDKDANVKIGLTVADVCGTNPECRSTVTQWQQNVNLYWVPEGCWKLSVSWSDFYPRLVYIPESTIKCTEAFDE